MESNLSTCEALDAAKKQWRYVAPMLSAPHALASVATDDGHIFAIGGWINGSECTTRVERYSVATNTWTPCTPLLVARRLHGACEWSGKFYVFGGSIGQNSHTKAVECYDPATGKWEPRAGLPQAGCACAAAVGGYIYVFVMGQRVLCYDPDSDQYKKRNPLPLPEWYCFAHVVFHGHVYVLGGVTKGAWTDAVYCYHPADDTWHELPRMRSVRRRCSAGILDVGPEPAVEDVQSEAVKSVHTSPAEEAEEPHPKRLNVGQDAQPPLEGQLPVPQQGPPVSTAPHPESQPDLVSGQQLEQTSEQ